MAEFVARKIMIKSDYAANMHEKGLVFKDKVDAKKCARRMNLEEEYAALVRYHNANRSDPETTDAGWIYYLSNGEIKGGTLEGWQFKAADKRFVLLGRYGAYGIQDKFGRNKLIEMLSL